jgi:hypothetical protein
MAVIVLVGALSGCISIKSQSSSQRAPGVITLDVLICASDSDRDVYPDCDPEGPDKNTAESDNGVDAEDGQRGQVLAGFRVPAGTRSPDSFPSASQEVIFTRSQTYTAELNERFPQPASTQWVGYISTPKLFDLMDPAGRQVRFRPEFTLPSQADGRPFAVPFPWRAVVGLRRITNDGQAGAPVACTTGTVCVDSPVPAGVPLSLSANVSDFGVRPGTSAAAGHGETATVSFPIEYLDGGGLGAQEFTLTATTDMPRTAATLGQTTLNMAPDSSGTVNVAIPVPPGTPLGSYTVTLTAATGTPSVTRSNTAAVAVIDKRAPGVRISVPADGATFVRGQSVVADYACTEETGGSGVRSCVGPVASGARLDTDSVGTKTFMVNAADNAGNAVAATSAYRVVRPRVPITARLSFNFRAFRRFTTLTRFEVKNVPRGARLKATCALGKRKCPGKARKSLTKRRARGTVSLNARYKGVRLPAGTKITVTVTRRGNIGAVKILTIRSAKAPRVTDRCLPPGARNPRRRC